MMWCSMNYAILGPLVEIMRIASTHLVKYFVTVIMNLWPSNEVGEICPIKSNSHLENGHNDCIGCKD